MEKFKLWLYDVWVWIASWFEDHKRLYITHNQYNADGEIIDVLEKAFDVRKFHTIILFNVQDCVCNYLSSFKFIFRLREQCYLHVWRSLKIKLKCAR